MTCPKSKPCSERCAFHFLYITPFGTASGFPKHLKLELENNCSGNRGRLAFNHFAFDATALTFSESIHCCAEIVLTGCASGACLFAGLVARQATASDGQRGGTTGLARVLAAGRLSPARIRFFPICEYTMQIASWNELVIFSMALLWLERARGFICPKNARCLCWLELSKAIPTTYFFCFLAPTSHRFQVR